MSNLTPWLRLKRNRAEIIRIASQGVAYGLHWLGGRTHLCAAPKCPACEEHRPRQRTAFAGWLERMEDREGVVEHGWLMVAIELPSPAVYEPGDEIEVVRRKTQVVHTKVAQVQLSDARHLSEQIVLEAMADVMGFPVPARGLIAETDVEEWRAMSRRRMTRIMRGGAQ
jgi:hypothetical protein